MPDPAGTKSRIHSPESPTTIGGRLHRALVTRLLPGVLTVGALACLFFMLQFVVTRSGASLDFIGPYTAARIVHQGSARRLYDLHLQRELESQFVPGGRFLPFDHPPFEAWLYLPLARLPYSQAYLIWAAFNLLVLAGVFYFLRFTGFQMDSDSRLVWLATCFPLVTGALVLGQDSLLLVPVFLFAFLMLKRRQDVIAGLALGSGLFRFEILLPFALIFLLRRRWKVLAGFSVMALAALLVSVPLVGWSGLVGYGKVLVNVGRVTGSAANGVNVATMPTLRGALAAFSGGAISPTWLFALAMAGSLLLLVWAASVFRHVAKAESPAFDLEFSFAVIAALLASYHVFAHELTPLIVIAFLILHSESVRHRNLRLLERRGAALLLLFVLVMVVGGAVGFRDYSVLFVVLAGMMISLWRDLAEIENREHAR